MRTPRPGVTPTSGDGLLALGRAARPRRAANPGVSTTGSGIGLYDDEDDGVPGRSWLRLAAVVAACMLLLVAVVFAFNLGQGRSALEFDDEPTSDDATPSASAAASQAQVVTGTTASDLDPQGEPPEENPDLAGNVVDGDPDHDVAHQHLQPAVRSRRPQDRRRASSSTSARCATSAASR